MVGRWRWEGGEEGGEGETPLVAKPERKPSVELFVDMENIEVCVCVCVYVCVCVCLCMTALVNGSFTCSIYLITVPYTEVYVQ